MQPEEGENDKKEAFHKSILFIIANEKRKATKGIVVHPSQMYQERNLGGGWQAMQPEHIKCQEYFKGGGGKE